MADCLVVKMAAWKVEKKVYCLVVLKVHCLVEMLVDWMAEKMDSL